MHQVYDDKMTFKLVAAASSVSGLPIETCLEEFGKHFLVYCQKNGYDQILRVLGSNLYDFLTNLDNLHDHLASIYPGMRAPSFRVTRHMNTNRSDQDIHLSQSAVCASLTGSMYLHYYSERAGLSPIVKGLVMAVAREFFHTDISVSEIDSDWAKGEQAAHDDHVVLKIDRRPSESQQSPAQPGDQQSASEQRRQSAAGETAAGPAPMVSIYDSLSANPQDSMVNSEIMMQTFPFHVIFDKRFTIVQVGNSLLRATSLFWRRRCLDTPASQPSPQPPPPGAGDARANCAETHSQIRFSDLFNIIRPKIDFTFDAIADHTNQVFVVKTRPQVLNADFLRSQGSGCSSQQASPINQASSCPAPSPGRCPMDRIAEQRRKAALQLEGEFEAAPTQQQQQQQQEQPVVASEQTQLAPVQDGTSEPQHLGLRLKGQMIILPGGELCLYLCSPRVDHLDQLLECGVNMADFALHDRARELMLMSHTHKEDRETVKKLDQASNDLKKMDTKLRLENKRTNEVLHNIFPAKIATLLSHGLKVESESFETVTCLYSDIIGFTKMCGSENVRPIDIVRLLNTLYLQFDNLTNIHGVFKVETIGDAYVVVGGLPEPVEDHADRCVRMGLDMVKVIRTVRSPADGNPIQMRIGIHSGPVMAGIVGIRVPRYSLFGNTTTLANQLETNGVGGKIHISDFTLKNLIERDRFVVEDNPSQINGIPFVTYFVTNYLGDKNETLEHERLLEEQLIKDLELMGSELELVDDSSQPDAPFRVPDSANYQSAHLAGPSSQAGHERRQLNLTPTLSETLAGEKHQTLVMDIEDQRLAKPASSHHRSRRTSNELKWAREKEEEKAQEEEEKEDEHEDRADQRACRMHYLQQMSARLSAIIIEEAIKQSIHPAADDRCSQAQPARLPAGPDATRRQLSTRSAENLLALLVNRQAQLKLVLNPPSNGQTSSELAASQADQPACCPVCAGSGELVESRTIQLHVALADSSLTGAFTTSSAGGANLSRDESDGSRFRWPSQACNIQSSSEGQSSSNYGAPATEMSRNEAGCPNTSDFERLVAELRLERRYLEAQIERLAQISVATTSSKLAKAPVLVQPQPQSVLGAGLSRMKRMDTLKLRRLKRIQEQQRGGQAQMVEPTSNRPPRPISEAPEEDDERPASSGELAMPAPEVRSARAFDGLQRHPAGPSGYQALRASIAGLMGDVQSTAGKRKSCFSLGSFQLPFGSPQRHRNSSPAKDNAGTDSDLSSRPPQVIVQLPDGLPDNIVPEDSRQRHTSSGRINSRRATSCLCLRSSSSSQSVSDSVSARVR